MLEHNGTNQSKPTVSNTPANDSEGCSTDADFEREDLGLVDPRDTKLLRKSVTTTVHRPLTGRIIFRVELTQVAPKTKVNRKTPNVATIPWAGLVEPCSMRWEKPPAMAMAMAWRTAPM